MMIDMINKIIRQISLIAILLIIPSISYAQQIASNGTLVTSLSTSSAGVVTGTPFAIPLTSASLITWTITSDSAVLSVNLEGSVDNSSWFTIDSNTTTGVKNYGFTAVRFARISQVSRTGGTITTGTIVTARGFVAGNNNVISSPGKFLAGNGTLTSPSYSFTSEQTSGWFRNGAGDLWLSVLGVPRFKANTVSTSLLATDGGAYFSVTPAIVQVNSAILNFSNAGTGKFSIQIPVNDGWMTMTNNASTIGSVVKIDALPTVASGFGTSPTITAGSTPLAGSVNVGTGAAGAGVINFNGTAFPSAPFCVVLDDSTVLAVRATATTTQLTITPTATFTASDIISWICISSK